MSDGDSSSRRAQNLRRIRERGAEAAERILLEKGQEALTVRGLADRIGCSVGTIYNAFGDIEGALREVNLRSFALLQSALETASTKAGRDLERRLVAIAEAYFDFAQAHPERWHLLFDRPIGTPEDTRLIDRQGALIARFLATLPEGEGAFSRRDLLSFQLLWASVHGLVSLTQLGSLSDVSLPAARRYLKILVQTALRAGAFERR